MAESSNIYIFNKKGFSLNKELLGSLSLKYEKLSTNSEYNALFNFYNKDKELWGQEELDSKELNTIFDDIKKVAGSDGVLSKDEISAYLKKHKLNNKVKESSFANFIMNIGKLSLANMIHDDISGLGTSSRLADDLANIPPSEIINFLESYKKEYGNSLVQDIADEFGCKGATREQYLNVVRDKIIDLQKIYSETKSKTFKSQFDSIVKDMDMTLLSRADATKLDALINATAKTIYKRDVKTLEKDNRRLISQIMSNPKLCWVSDNKDKIVERIMSYSKLNSPVQFVEPFLKSKSAVARQAAKNLLDSNILDFFPLYVASIIAQESQFRETDPEIFGRNGQGTMQITSSMVADMYERPKAYGTAFFERIKTNYPDSTSLFNALKDTKNVKVSLNYDVGTAGLAGKIGTVLQKIENGTYDYMKLNLTSPSVVLELAAMGYNGNSEGKKDAAHNGNKSQVRYIYGREVIERFKSYTPTDIKINDYFDYDPATNKFNRVKY